MIKQAFKRYLETAVFIQHRIFPKLVNEYGISNLKYDISIPETYNEYLDREYELRYKKYCDCADSMFGNIYYDNLLYDSSFMFTRYEEDNDTMRYRIICPKRSIIEILYKCQDDNLVREYIEICLRHEIGHILYIEECIKNIGIEHLSEYLYDESANFNKEYWSFYNELNESDVADDDVLFDTETCKKYYSLAPESEANRCANVNVDRLIELELKVRSDVLYE